MTTMDDSVMTGCGCSQRYRVSQLGETDAENLVRLRVAALARHTECAPARFRAWLRDAHQYGYSMDSLGQVIGITRERIRQLILQAEDVSGVPLVVGAPPPALDLPWPTQKALRLRWPRPTLTSQEVDSLHTLQEGAKQCRGNMAADDARREASERLTSTLTDLVDRRGFSYAELAAALGVQPRTVFARLRRHGRNGGPPPSQKRYQGAPATAYRKPPRQVKDHTVRREIAALAGIAAPRKPTEDQRARTWRKLSPRQQEFLTDLVDRRQPHLRNSRSVTTSRSLSRRGLIESGYGHRLTEAGRDLMAWARPNGSPSQSTPKTQNVPDAECGTPAGYERHRRLSEYCCKPCLHAVQYRPVEPYPDARDAR